MLGGKADGVITETNKDTSAKRSGFVVNAKGSYVTKRGEAENGKLGKSVLVTQQQQ